MFPRKSTAEIVEELGIPILENALDVSWWQRLGLQTEIGNMVSNIHDIRGYIQSRYVDLIFVTSLQAYNGCIIAYGQTGSGKSHSVPRPYMMFVFFQNKCVL